MLKRGWFERWTEFYERARSHSYRPISPLCWAYLRKKSDPVMQGVVRTGQVVQGFDVSMANKNDVVLFVVNETTNDQTLYLTSAEGTLRRMVSVEAGVGKVRRITNQDRKAFEKEKQFWLDRLSPGP